MQWNVPILSVQFHKLWQIHTLIWASPEPSSCRAFPHPTNFPHVLLSQPLVPLWPHWSAFDHCRLDLFSRAFHVNTPRSFLSPLSSPLPCDPFCKMSKQEGLSVWQFLYGRKKWRPPDVRGVLPKVHRKQWRARRAAQGLDSPFRAYSPPYLFPAIWLEVQRYIVFNPTFSWAPLESHFNCAYDFTLNLLCLFWGSLATLSKGWSKTDDECGEDAACWERWSWTWGHAPCNLVTEQACFCPILGAWGVRATLSQAGGQTAAGRWAKAWGPQHRPA